MLDIHKRSEEMKTDVSALYVDANNLYGNAMSDYLPLDNFQWMSEEEIQTFDVNQIGKEDEYGFTLEVDLSAYDGVADVDVAFFYSDNDNWANVLAVDDVLIRDILLFLRHRFSRANLQKLLHFHRAASSLPQEFLLRAAQASNRMEKGFHQPHFVCNKFFRELYHYL